MSRRAKTLAIDFQRPRTALRGASDFQRPRTALRGVGPMRNVGQARPLNGGMTIVLATVLLALCTAAATAQPPSAEPPLSAEDLAEKSLPLRTALHHDPTLRAPLERLLSLYGTAGKTAELLDVYRAHVRQYPADPGGRTVLVCLLSATGDPEALPAARAAVAKFPENAYLQFVFYEILQRRNDPDALDHLDKAISLEKRPNRKMARIDLLLPLAVNEDRRDLAEKHLRALADAVDRPEDCLVVAQKMLKYDFHKAALEAIEKGAALQPTPETMVSMELEAATAEVGLQNSDEAGARLDRLLAKLTADYWRRQQIVRRRLALVDTEPERQAMIDRAKKRVASNPRDVAAVLDLAQVLSGLQYRREALDALMAAGRRLPKSVEIEQRVLDLFDRLRDEYGREKYLAGRIEALPDRDDLVLLHVKTLYMLGRRDAATDKLTELLAQVEPAERIAGLLEMARYLRRSAMPTEAAGLFRQVVDLAPARLDVRRELAEVYLVVGQKHEVRELFAAGVPQGADLENLLDLVQFMVQQELFIEARAALAGRLEGEQGNLDLRMLLLSIERRLGNFDAGEKLIEQCRSLADTGARYRLWLEAAVLFHEDFDTAETFLDAERTRLDEHSGESPARRLERRLAYADVASGSGRRNEVIAMLEADLEQELPSKDRIRIRRQMIAMLQRGMGPTDPVQQQLERLAKDAPEMADECNARLAVLRARGDRADLAQALLPKIDLLKINDASLLQSLLPLYRSGGAFQKQTLTIVQRLTVLEPANRSHWQQWLAALASMRNESRLRGAMRVLLAGIDKMPLSDETRALLERHVADSYWREIAEQLADDTPASLAETLPLLDTVERMARDDQQWLWTSWIRAYVLGRLGRNEPRDEAIAELERMVARVTLVPLPEKKPGEEKPEEPETAPPPRIAFPDGLTVSLEHARRLLSEVPVVRPVSPRPTRDGPLPGFTVRWAFEVPAKATVTAVVPLGESRTLIFDSTATAYCVDVATGKLLWQRGVDSTAKLAINQPATYPTSLASTLIRFDGKDRLYVPGNANVRCYAIDDGRLLWRADVGAIPKPPNSSGAAVTAVFLCDEQLLTYEPVSGTLTRIDPATGKIVWDRAFAAEGPASLAAGGTVKIAWQNAGASLCGDRLLVYGARTAVLDARTGDVLWSFEPYRVRTFPVKLKSPSDKRPATPAMAMAMPAMGMAMPAGGMGGSWGGSYPPGMNPFGGPVRFSGAVLRGQQAVQHIDYLQHQGAIPVAPQANVALSPPAVVWAASARQGGARWARLTQRRLLLFDGSGLRIVPIEFPLAGKTVPASGQLLGIVGRTVCLLAGSQLNFINVTDGTTRYYQCHDVAGQPTTPLQATLDGPLIYVTGPGGILCVNAATAQRVFHAPWPDEAEVPELPKTPVVVAATAVNSAPGYPSRVMPSPYYSGGLGGMAHSYSSLYVSPSSAYPTAQPQPQVRVSPTISRADRGILYTLVTPTRVVALVGQGSP